jgi:hypothetical protein
MSDQKKYRAGARKRKLEDLLEESPPPTWEEIQVFRKYLRRKALRITQTSMKRLRSTP